MKMINENVKGYRLSFVNNSEGTRYGFRHTCDLFIDDYRRSHISHPYYNRTWEAYQYQTVMLEAIEDIMRQIYDSELRYYKEYNDIKRLTAEKKKEFDEQFNNDLYKALKEAYYDFKANTKQ